MIYLLKRDDACLGKFIKYMKLTGQLCEVEEVKLTQAHPEFIQTGWSFTVHPHQQIQALLDDRHINLTHISLYREAAARHLEVIEICTGYFAPPALILVTPDMDIEALRKNWCERYCLTYYYDQYRGFRNFLNSPKISALPDNDGRNLVSKVKKCIARVAQFWAMLARKGK